MRMTRRRFNRGALLLGTLTLGGVAAGGARHAAGGGARHAAGGPSAARLEADLSACLASNPTHAKFTVPVFERHPPAQDGRLRLVAQVRLDWAPGMRLRVLHATGSTTEDAYDALRDAAMALFVGVVPGFAAPAAAA